MHSVAGRFFWTAAALAWLGVLSAAFLGLWKYETTPGIAARAPITWPVDSRVPRRGGVPALVLSMHPRCPCSRATVEELAKLMAHCHDRLAVTVLMIRPEGAAVGWEKSDLWCSAAAIPGVFVMTDESGIESRRFGTGTSGQAMLYAKNGE